MLSERQKHMPLEDFVAELNARLAVELEMAWETPLARRSIFLDSDAPMGAAMQCAATANSLNTEIREDV